MSTSILITLSAEELKAIVAESIQPLVEEIADMRQHVRPHRSVLSVGEVAADAGFSVDTVRTWIVEGRSVPGRSRRVKLKIMDGISDGPYRIRWEAYRQFLSEFPDVTAART